MGGLFGGDVKWTPPWDGHLILTWVFNEEMMADENRANDNSVNIKQSVSSRSSAYVVQSLESMKN